MPMLRPVLLLVLPILVLSACRKGEEAEASEPLTHQLQRREATRTRTAEIQPREMVRRLSTTTTIDSKTQIELFPRVAGVIEEVSVEEGETVEQGQVLATLDQREASARLEDARLAVKEAADQVARLELSAEEALERARSAELSFQQAKSEFERNEKAKLISEVDLEKLGLTRDTSERTWKATLLTHRGAVQDLEQQNRGIERAELTASRELLTFSYTEIVAPFDGVVATRMVRVGDTVSSGAAAFTLTDPQALRCVVPRPQRELTFFQASRAEGAEIEIRVVPEAFPEYEYEGRIEIISPTIDTESGSFRLTIGLDQPALDSGRPQLLPGMMVRLTIVTERQPNALVVPKRALRREGDRHYLYLVQENKAARVEVIEGLSDDEFVAVEARGESPLEEGMEVVVVGNRDLEDGEELETERWTPKESVENAGEATQEPAEEASEEDGDEIAATGEEPAEGTGPTAEGDDN